MKHYINVSFVNLFMVVLFGFCSIQIATAQVVEKKQNYSWRTGPSCRSGTEKFRWITPSCWFRTEHAPPTSPRS